MSANNVQIGGEHYVSKSIQPWDAMQSWMSKEEFEGFLRGNSIKYIARYKDKNGLEDLLKAKHYLEKLIELQQPAPTSEADALREEVEMLRSHINNGIEKTCGFFCALPECPRAQQKSDSF